MSYKRKFTYTTINVIKNIEIFIGNSKLLNIRYKQASAGMPSVVILLNFAIFRVDVNKIKFSDLFQVQLHSGKIK